MKVLVMGLGYVGLPLAARAAEVGNSVVGVDLDKSKIDSLRHGTSYIEDVSSTRLQAAMSGHHGHHLVVCDRLALGHRGWDIAIVTVPTPLRNGEPDLTYVLSAAEELGKIMVPGGTIVLESTTYPGTTEGPFREALEQHSGLKAGVDFHLGFSPERIDPGPRSTHTLENTPKLVSGTTPEALKIIRNFYASIVDEVVPVSSTAVAELTKVFENVQAFVNIALVNELQDICRNLGLDVYEVLDAMMTKGHSVSYWTPGPGVGGHCLPVDSLYLTWQARHELGSPARLIETAAEINNSRPDFVVRRALDLLAEREITPRKAEVLVMGLAYKPDVGDTRESPALDVVAGLTGRGCRVTVLDPLVEGWTSTPALTIEELPAAVKDFDLVVVTTHHSVFEFDKVQREAVQVLDTRHVVPAGENVVQL